MRLPSELAHRVDMHIAISKDGHGSRTDFTTDAVRRLLAECEEKDQRREEFKKWLQEHALEGAPEPFKRPWNRGKQKS